MVNMVNTAVNNNIYAGRKSGSKYNQSKAFATKGSVRDTGCCSS